MWFYLSSKFHTCTSKWVLVLFLRKDPVQQLLYWHKRGSWPITLCWGRPHITAAIKESGTPHSCFMPSHKSPKENFCDFFFKAEKLWKAQETAKVHLITWCHLAELQSQLMFRAFQVILIPLILIYFEWICPCWRLKISGFAKLWTGGLYGKRRSCQMLQKSVCKRLDLVVCRQWPVTIIKHHRRASPVCDASIWAHVGPEETRAGALSQTEKVHRCPRFHTRMDAKCVTLPAATDGCRTQAAAGLKTATWSLIPMRTSLLRSQACLQGTLVNNQDSHFLDSRDAPMWNVTPPLPRVYPS